MKAKNDMELLEEKGDILSENLDKYGNRLKVFDVNEILRDDLIHIKPEHAKLYNGILTYIKTDVPKNILVQGVRGTGKTLLTRKFSEKLAEKFKDDIKVGIHYVNCRDNFRELAVLQCIINKFQRGVSTSKVNDEFNDLIEKYERNIIILDEIESLDDVNALYTLTNTPKVIVIATSLTGKVLEKVESDSSVKARFNPQHIFFGTYNVDDLFIIFNKRIRYALDYNEDNENLDDNLKRLSAMLKKDYNTDLRVGIETILGILKYEVNFSFLEKHSDQKLTRLYKEYLAVSEEKVAFDIINDLESTQLLILFSVCLAKRANRDSSIIDSYKIYKNIVDSTGFGKDMTSRAYRKYIPGLQSQECFAQIEKKTKGRSTIHTVVIDEIKIDLTFQIFRKQFPSAELSERYMKLMMKTEATTVLDYTKDDIDEDEMVSKVYEYFGRKLPKELIDDDFNEMSNLFNIKKNQLIDILENKGIVKKLKEELNQWGSTKISYKVLKPKM